MAENRNTVHEGTLPDRATMKFEYQNPTRLVFAAGALSRLGEVVSAYGKRALLVTGSGSVKRSGAFERAVSSLKAVGVSVAECPGVEPYPRLSSVVRGAQIARGEGRDVVIGMGGGSTMDAAKVIAAAVFYKGEPWDMIAHRCRTASPGGPSLLRWSGARKRWPTEAIWKHAPRYSGQRWWRSTGGFRSVPTRRIRCT